MPAGANVIDGVNVIDGANIIDGANVIYGANFIPTCMHACLRVCWNECYRWSKFYMCLLACFFAGANVIDGALGQMIRSHY